MLRKHKISKSTFYRRLRELRLQQRKKNGHLVSKCVLFDNIPSFIRYEKKVSNSTPIARKTPKICLKTKKFVAPDKKIL